MKKLISLMLCFCMFCGFVPQMASAASTTLSLEQELAEDLKSLGLFRGVSDTDFALSRKPTRVEALVMLIRILGRENDALTKGGKHPFLDVPSWADKYVGYAYENKLTNGISATKFGSGDIASSSMYITFVLRALGYSDAAGDFSWDNPYALARTAGIMLGNPDIIGFLRADVVLISYAALEAEVKGTGKTLADKLIEAGAISAAAYATYYDVSVFAEAPTPATQLSAEEIYKKCSPAVFFVEVYDEEGQMFATGSGFFIDSDGTAVTNYHVIEGAASARITCSDTNRKYKVLGVYDYDTKNDWAVIAIDGSNFPYLELDKTPVTGGATVYAIGSPLGLQNTISEGLISNTNRYIDGVSYIQTSAATSSGSSGGALINRSGKVIGITTAGFSGGQNLNLAVPVSAFEGFTKGKAHSLSALYDNSSVKYFGNINLSGFSKEERTYELLRMWVQNYRTTVYNGLDAYHEAFETDSGDISFVLSYDDSSDSFIVSAISESSKSCAEGHIRFNRYSNNTDCEFYYYFDKYMKNPDLKGVATVSKYEFSENFSPWFSDFYGGYNAYDYKSDCEDIAGSLYYAAIDFIDYLLRSYLEYYEPADLYELGFTSMEN
ncbi:MAG: serine protease [Oscillospiraceae bacterium]|nr:serine protease [Oscillospiraceae bacterium]